MLKLSVEHDFLLNNVLNEETEVIHQVNRINSFPDGSVVNNMPATERDVGLITGLEDPLEKEMATHSSILAWRIPWTEELGEL